MAKHRRGSVAMRLDREVHMPCCVRLGLHA